MQSVPFFVKGLAPRPWVEEYLEDELVDDSDDEKHIQKVEFRRGRKLKATAAKNAKKKGGLMQKQSVQGGEISLAGWHPTCAFWRCGARFKPACCRQFSLQVAWSCRCCFSAGPPLQGPCFNCGKMGHVKNFCPLLQRFAQAGKWRVFVCSSHDYIGYSVEYYNIINCAFMIMLHAL